MIRQPIVTVAGHVDHGKCVAGDTLIPLVDGTIITAKEIFEDNFKESEAQNINDGILQEVNDKNIKIFSFNGKKIEHKPISHIWKRKAETLIEIKTSSGDIIKTTPEHPFFVFSLDGIKEKRADLIQEGESIAVPKSISSKDSHITPLVIKKIKNIKNFVCFLGPDSEELIKKIKEAGISNLESMLKIKNLRDSIKNKRFKINNFFAVCSYLRLDDEQAYRLIKSIKNANEGWRVGHTSNEILLSNLIEYEKLGYILGCLAGDGHISNIAILNNNDEEIQDAYMKYLKEIFGTDSRLKQGHTCQIITDSGALTFSRFLKEVIGFPEKDKSANIYVPEIAKKNKEIFKGFFAGLFDTDGYVSKINHCIEITSKSKRLLKECSILLLNFGIHSVVYEKNGFYNLRIANKLYLERFLQNFMPRLKRKKQRIESAILKAQTSRIFDFLPINGSILNELIVGGKINKKIPYFNKYTKTSSLSNIMLSNTISNVKQENEISNKIKALLGLEVSYVKIISKRTIENKEGFVYDFTIPQTHNFVAERILVHNTSILDSIRKTAIASGEAGGITQKISFTKIPISEVYKMCPVLEKGAKLEFPGVLFIDTPGHAAFSHLRKRGGSLADLAILVIDINEGIKPQTQEVIDILKHNKTPFIVALNKVDNISGWRKMSNSMKESIEMQAVNVQENFQEKLLTLIANLQRYGFNPKPFYEITDFSKELALVPCSARTKEGINELTMTFCGLCQKFLKKQLTLGETAKGVILEVKKEKTMQYAEAILYDGELNVGDEIAIATFDEPIITKIRVLEEIEPISSKFKPSKKVTAATGIRMQLINSEGILSGMPFILIENNLEEIKKEFKKEVGLAIESDEQGIIIKADSLGSLEALRTLLKQEHIRVIRAGIGKINKKDVISAQTNLKEDPTNAIVLGFNTQVDDEVKEVDTNRIKILTDEVIYKLIENLLKYQEEKRNEIKREKLMHLSTICKLSILHQYIFRNSNPAVFGVRIEGGKLKSGTPLINESGEPIAKVRDIQENQNKLEVAQQGMEIAMSLPGTNYERQLKETNTLYSDLSENQFRQFKENKDLLTQDEIQVLQKIAEIKRRQKTTWGV